MKKSPYTDPRWQKLRLQVFERDGWKCVGCGAAEKTLHVHHRRYSGRAYEAELGDLVTLCEDCHAWLEDAIADVRDRGCKDPMHVRMATKVLLDAGEIMKSRIHNGAFLLHGLNYSSETRMWQYDALEDIRRQSGERPNLYPPADYSI